MKYICLLLFCCSFLFIACGDDDEGTVTPLPRVILCGNEVKVDETKYVNAVTAPYQITDVRIEGHCMTIDIAASGCSVDNWRLSGYASEAIAEPIPIIRYAKFDFEVQEACQAFFQTSFEFDLRNWQVDSENVMNIDIEGWEPLVRYEY